ncbi:MAG: hypothetical protein ABUS79_12675 [Pseudomonadota bacterium]
MTTRTTTLFARIGLSLSAGLLMICAGMTLAEAAPKRLGIVNFRGPGEGATRNAVMKAAKAKKYQVVGGQQIAKAASKLKVSLDTNDSFLSVARELGISAFVTGEVTKKKATLTVRLGADGSVGAEASWSGPNPRKLSAAVHKTFWRRLGSAIDRAKAPSGAKQAAVAEAEPVPETGADEPGDDDNDKKSGKEDKKSDEKKTASADESDGNADGDGDGDSSRRSKKKKKKSADDESGDENVISEKAEPEETDSGERPEALVLAVGPRVLSRSLNYVQDIYRGNSKYSLPAAPEVGLAVDVYPAAFSTGGFAANIGLTAAFSYMLPVVKTPVAAGMGTGSYTTYSQNWSIGAKVRLPMGVFGTVAYGDQRYQLLKPSTGGGIDVPMVDYRYVRVGAGGRIKVTPEVSLMANFGYLHCLALGQIKTTAYFPKATCGAVELGAGLGYRFTRSLELQAGGELRRYGLAFHNTPADAQDPSHRIAGGAVDQYIMGYVALAVVFGGESAGGGGHSEAAEEEAEAPKEAKADDEEASDEAKGEEEAEKPAKKKSGKKNE